jgi:hypothetical protein
MVGVATSAEMRAEHWNNVHVGCSIIVLNKDLDPAEPSIYSGANRKNSSEMLAFPNRMCGESEAFVNALDIEGPNHKFVDSDVFDRIGWAKQKGDLGVVVAVVAVSKSRNTGEPDRLSHDVLLPCNQCLTTYQDMVDMGILSSQTIIYNARINEQGKDIAGEPVTVGKLLEDFKKTKEERNRRSIQDLFEVKDRAVAEFLTASLEFKKNIPASEMGKRPGSIGKGKEGLARERKEVLIDEIAIFAGKVRNALLSAFEEGLSKQSLVEVLGLKESYINQNTKGFSNNEIKSILEELEKPLIADFLGLDEGEKI